MSSVRHFQSGRPFGEYAQKYRENGWINPIPLPYKEKHPPPIGWTGHRAPDVDLAQLQMWLDCNSKSNIGLRLNYVEVQGNSASPELLEIIGLDIDERPGAVDELGAEVDSGKHGLAQLKVLEKKLGALPETWSSSARFNGSEIRFFLAPSGLAWKGNCGKLGPDIDVISRGYRFAVVFPSIHPEGGLYRWFPPGVSSGDNFDEMSWGAGGFGPAFGAETSIQERGVVMGPGAGESGPAGALGGRKGGLRVPTVQELSRLPGGWVDFLTSGRTEYVPAQVDLDISEEKLIVWAATHFAEKKKMCVGMQKALAKFIVALEDTDGADYANSHGLILKAHYQLLKMGSLEKHSGWVTATREFEKKWLGSVVGRNKRTPEDGKREYLRSRIGALRRLKGGWPEGFSVTKDGGACACFDYGDKSPFDSSKSSDRKISHVIEAGGVDVFGRFEWLKKVELQEDSDPADFEKNDSSQAAHFVACYRDSVKWVKGWESWMIYDPIGKMWRMDKYHNVTFLFQDGCMNRIRKRSRQFYKLAEEHLKSGGHKVDLRYKELWDKGKYLESIYQMYSNVGRSESALRRASEMPGVTVEYADLNADLLLLPLSGGKVVRLVDRGKAVAKGNTEGNKGFEIEDNRPENYTTNLVAAQWIPGGFSVENLNKWRLWRKEYMEGKWKENSSGAGEKLWGLKLLEQWEVWEQTLNLILPIENEDTSGVGVSKGKEYRRFVRKVLGSCLIGGNPEKKIIFLIGPPNTGKSTLVNCLVVALGDLAGPFNLSLFTAGNSGGGTANPELAGNLFKRIICASEAGALRMEANEIKRYTGKDLITVRRLYSNTYISGYVHFTAIVSSNFPPRIIGEDAAVRARILALPLNSVIEDSSGSGVRDTSATERIPWLCKEAVFYWLLLGYRDYVREGLDENSWDAKVLSTTGEFVSEMSDVGAFLSEVCELAPSNVIRRFAINKGKFPRVHSREDEKELRAWCEVTVAGLYSLYKVWVGDGEKHLGKRNFGNSVRGQGIFNMTMRHGKGTAMTWVGLKIRKDKVRELFGASTIGKPMDNLDFS